MKRIGNYWVDSRGNKWSCEVFTKDKALIASKTCINCKNCTDCEDCTSCVECVACVRCTNCYTSANCVDCVDCTSCTNCTNCRDSRYCIVCTFCNHCGECNNCNVCRHCKGCRDCKDCKDCNYCSCCISCLNCESCSDYHSNPARISSPRIGSRHDHTHLYWLGENTQVICGCYRGSLEEFEKKVKEVHNDTTRHYEDYISFIDVCKYAIKHLR
jgi:hypothetical protein